MKLRAIELLQFSKTFLSKSAKTICSYQCLIHFKSSHVHLQASHGYIYTGTAEVESQKTSVNSLKKSNRVSHSLGPMSLSGISQLEFHMNNLCK